jgi:hypothetical protein
MPTRLTPTLSTALYRDNRSTRSDRNESSLETFDYQYVESHELDQNRSRRGVKEHADCLGLLGDGLSWRKGITPAADFPQRITASASVLPRPIGSFDGNHEQDVEPEPVDMTTSSPPTGTVISALEASLAVASPDIVVVLRS